ncbi:MAG: lipid-A-disaccharide synthase [Nitrospinae bacterium]|nr:lipid-A-disaccharide synthase [Nitrospinota bacterium]
MERSGKIFIMAGEASGDLHGANLVRALRQQKPHLEFYGVGGPRMREAGVTTYFNITDLNTAGFVEVFGKLPSLYRIYRDIQKRLREEHFALAIFIDYPGLNIRLGKKARKEGVPPVYYIGPQLWAGRTPWRARRIIRAFARVLVIFPFEVSLYERKGGRAEFVGHPLLDLVRPSLSREEAMTAFALDEDRPIIGLLPGSRKSEIELLLPPILQSAQLIQRQDPRPQFLLALAGTVERHQVEDLLAQYPIEVKVVAGRPYDVMNVADFLIVASGTATLEAGLLEKPMVILYKFHFLTWLAARLMQKAPYLGLVNDLAGREIMPELQQYQVKPQRIAKIVLQALRDPEAYSAMQESLRSIRSLLGTEGAAQRAAHSILQLLEAGVRGQGLGIRD